MTIFSYTVNYIDVILAVIMVLGAVIGYVRGVFSTLIRFIRTAVGLFLCFYFSSYYTQPVYEAWVRPRLLETINEKIVVSGNIDEVINNLNNYILSLPAFIADSLNTKELSLTSDDIANAVLTNVFEPFALKIIKAALFIAVFIIFFGATGIIIYFVKRRNKKKEEKRGYKSTLQKTDKLLGLFFGIIKAFIIALALTSVLLYIINSDASLSESSPFWLEVQNSLLLKYINEINPFNAVTEGLL